MGEKISVLVAVGATVGVRVGSTALVQAPNRRTKETERVKRIPKGGLQESLFMPPIVSPEGFASPEGKFPGDPLTCRERIESGLAHRLEMDIDDIFDIWGVSAGHDHCDRKIPVTAVVEDHLVTAL